MQMNDDQEIEDLCCLDQPDLFRALGEPSRIALLLRLAALKRSATVGELAPCCTKDMSVVSRHLSCLRAVGVVEAEKRGRKVWYRLTTNLPTLLRQMADALDPCCPDENCC